ncbi:hypothetical protein BVG16_16470 [Paenibacillus selenitireducens]|uniref:Uncharacterized protein n=1 Tax=Paenibacillus selenitireducens TaxID=1324314 RepID=A0A1T2XA32_9BACL|nr:replicative helicase loader/inhibitor [Paenibacillus selenitireducens]OPA76764.1 hypothetical protein BVG16_16470 [Paenibacillus selenitireducens]
MNRQEFGRLLRKIVLNYPHFDVANDERNDEWIERLKDFPIEAAIANIEQHTLTERFPPTIADIRGRLGEQLERDRSKAAAAEYFEQLDAWKQNAAPPPPGLREKIHEILRLN